MSSWSNWLCNIRTFSRLPPARWFPLVLQLQLTTTDQRTTQPTDQPDHHENHLTKPKDHENLSFRLVQSQHFDLRVKINKDVCTELLEVAAL